MNRLKILFNGYEPALTDGNHLTSAGGGPWLSQLFKEMAKVKMDVINVSVGEKDTRENVFKNAIQSRPDAIILQWRWPMPQPQYKMRNLAFMRQCDLLRLAFHAKIPVLIHDQDLKNDPLSVCKPFIDNDFPIAFTMPAFNPPNGYETLHFPLPYEITPTDWDTPINFAAKKYEWSYIGNNYERYDEVLSVFGGDKAIEKDVHIWGNWLEPSESRESPEKVLADFPYVNFKGRLPQTEVLNVLRESIFTYHFAKPEYHDYGFMTIRWAEAAAAGCVAYVSPFFNAPDIVKDAFFPRFPYPLTLERYQSALSTQRAIVNKYQSAEAWISRLLTLMTKGK